MIEAQRGQLLGSDLELEANETRKFLGLKVFSSIEKFNEWNITFSTKHKAGRLFTDSLKDRLIAVQKPKVDLKEVEKEAYKILIKHKISPLPENIFVMTEIILLGKSEKVIRKPWLPYNVYIIPGNKKLSYLFLRVYKETRRDHVTVYWKRFEKQITYFQQRFLNPSRLASKFKVELDRRSRLVKVFIYSNTKPRHVKNNWSLVKRLQCKLSGYSEKSRPSNVDKLLRHILIDQGGKNDKDVDKAQRFSGEVDNSMTPGTFRQMRYRVKRLKKGE